MTESAARQQAQMMAKARSCYYDVVRAARGDFDYYPRYSDTVGRTDKGDVVASYDCYGRRLDTLFS